MANESKTPRTDERACDPKEYAHCFIDDKIDIVAACFARKLEQELAEARAEIARLTLLAQNQETVIDAQRRCAKAKNELIEQMREALEKCADFASKTRSEPDVLVVILQQINKISQAALSAAERGE